ncbi:4674_t:CDS:2, partial [Cetraspora pellucida]
DDISEVIEPLVKRGKIQESEPLNERYYCPSTPSPFHLTTSSTLQPQGTTMLQVRLWFLSKNNRS